MNHNFTDLEPPAYIFHLKYTCNKDVLCDNVLISIVIFITYICYVMLEKSKENS